MNIEYNGKIYPIVIETETGRWMAGKHFAGFGPGNMNQGFELVADVPEVAPKEDQKEDAPKT
jgi:hypothetical protein